MPSSTRFCLVRHGETTWNVDRRIQGQLDIPLNDHGLLQAHATAQALEDVRIDAIYSSDLARAWVTAGRIAVPRGQPVMPEPALRERHYGSFQGLTYAQARARHPADFDRFEAREPDACFPSGSGESLALLDARIWSLMESLRARHAGQTLLLVMHGGVLDIVARRVRRIGLTGPRDFDIANCALNWVAHGENDWRVERWGDVAHLELTLDELPA